MPEGDTIYRAAVSVRAAVGGKEVVDLWGSARELQRFARRLRGSTVTAVASRGKHHLVTFDDRFVLRTHMGMTGSWRVFAPAQRWNKSRGKARVVIETADAVAVCFAAPDIQLGTIEQIEQVLSMLGPDLLADDFEPSEAVALSHRSKATIVAELLLDQRVMAGVGNEYKSEVLFLEGLHPETAVTELDDAARMTLVTRSRDLLWVNKDRSVRSTTGSTRRGQEVFVYGRDRRNCRRCGTGVMIAELGEPKRITYWCPRCQPRSPGESRGAGP